MMSAAEFVAGDTLWVNQALKEVEKVNADYFGIIKHVDNNTNVALIHYFTCAEKQLVSIQRRVATGKGIGLQKGKQLYFYNDGMVEHMEVYTLVHDERQDTTRNRIASETYLYPDGATKEEVSLTYKSNKGGWETCFYTRKCYFPNGKLQYEEIKEENKELQITYYNEKGKKVKRPKQKFEIFEQMPEFPGGQEALFAYLAQNVKYPVVAIENNIQGRVIVQFAVAKDGKIEDAEVVRSGGDPSLDKEALRVIKAMPKWQPGRLRGKPVRVKYTVPVNFRLK